ncbi:MAG: hypothetical protein L3J44_09895 [Campylobacteraceae bacterium]|nr:hypothetical protein [Campylobacteraceae bacterium]
MFDNNNLINSTFEDAILYKTIYKHITGIPK